MNEIHNERGSVDADAAFRRLLEIAVVFGEYMERGLAERGLTRARATVLWQVHQHGPVTQRVLSQWLGVTPRNVTSLVDALAVDGLVTREQHPTDRRASLVTLTDAGRQRAAGLAQEYRSGAAYLFGALTSEELAGFVDTVDHVLARIERATPPRPAG